MAGPRAKFVTFEGMEGSGKSTQLRRVADYFLQKGLDVFVTREPGGTPLGNDIRALLLRSRDDAVDPLAELFLIQAARAQHVAQVVRPRLGSCDLLLCDRFTDATLAYQAAGRNLDREWVGEINRRAASDLVPDATILLDLSVTEGLKRALARIAAGTEKEDRFENEARAFHERVRETYLDLAKREPGRFFVVDADAPIPDITRSITSRLDRLLQP